MTKKVTTITAPRSSRFDSPAKPSGADPNATIGDAVEYVASNPSGLGYVVEAAKWLVGLVAALFRPAVKKP